MKKSNFKKCLALFLSVLLIISGVLSINFTATATVVNAFNDHMTNPENVVNGTYTGVSAQPDGSIAFNGTRNASITWKLPSLEKGRTYKFKAKILATESGTIKLSENGIWGFAIAKLKEDGGGIDPNNNVASGTFTEGNQTTAATLEYTFNTGYDTNFGLRLRFGYDSVIANAVRFYDFVLEDLTPEQTDFEKHMTNAENVTVTTTTSNEKYGNGIIFNEIDAKSITWKLPSLEKGKTYRFTAKFKPTNDSKIAHNSGVWGFAIAPQSSDIPNNSIELTGTSTEATATTAGEYDYTFSTGYQTDFWLRVAFSGCWIGTVKASGIYFYDFALEDITPALPEQTDFEKHMTNAENVTVTTTTSNEKYGNGIIFNEIDAKSITWKLPSLEKGKTYRFTAKFKPTNDSKIAHNSGVWGFAIAPQSSDIPNNSIELTGTSTEATATTAGEYDYTFSTGYQTDFWLRVAFSGCWIGTVKASGIYFYDFALEDITPALPEQTDFEKHMTNAENVTVTTTTSNEKYGNGIIFNEIDEKSITWQLPVLEKGMTYKFTAKFKPTNNSKISFPAAKSYGFAIAPQSTNIPDKNISVGTSTVATFDAEGSYEYTFDTGNSTEFWLRVGFSECWVGTVKANGIHFYDFELKLIGTTGLETAYNSVAALRVANQGTNIDKNGMRVYNSISKELFASKTIVEFGSIARREEMLNGAELTLDNLGTLKPGISYKQGEDMLLWEEKDNEYIFTAFLTGIKAENYGKNYVVRAYAKDSEGNVYYGKEILISVFDVAWSIDNGTSASGSTPTEYDLLAFESFAKGDDNYAAYASWLEVNNKKGGSISGIG